MISRAVKGLYDILRIVNYLEDCEINGCLKYLCGPGIY